MIRAEPLTRDREIGHGLLRCVTVNIDFPAAAVERAADEIIVATPS